ncbi:MAG: lysine biosynthesis protein LysX [Candidatus Nezhaarchaeota archaeon]|nr:lysine biosynthesis protein LysX [Candidatus Nezhaarchaeota archaeon]
MSEGLAVASIAILYDRLRWEEKELLKAARAKGVEAKPVDAKSLSLLPSRDLPTSLASVVLQRCMSHYRGLYASAFLETCGVRVVNSFAATHVCGDKLLTSLVLFKAGLPTPPFAVAFTAQSALKAIGEIGLPVVLKPIVGSHGRLVSMASNLDIAKALLEHEEAMGNGLHRVHFIQRYIEKPSRDVRVVVVGGRVVASIYRYAPEGEWRTNVAIGGRAEPCRLSSEAEELALKSSELLGVEVAGVDLMEAREGLLVNEVNPTVEFKGASQATGVDVAAAIISYVAEVVKR